VRKNFTRAGPCLAPGEPVQTQDPSEGEREEGRPLPPHARASPQSAIGAMILSRLIDGSRWRRGVTSCRRLFAVLHIPICYPDLGYPT
jgi:hypothetical protein